MQFQLISDLHLEYKKECPQFYKWPELPRLCPNLALLGDIGRPFEASYIDFLDAQAKKFENVFVVAGNHEFYNDDYPLKSMTKVI